MTTTQQEDTAGGLAYGLATFVLWGLTPLYFHSLHRVAPVEVLAHRIVWCALLLGVVLGARGAWPELVRCLRSRRLLGLLGASSLLFALSSLLYVSGVSSGRVLQCSLGYFVSPLFSVLLGTLFLRERLHARQWAALALAALGLVYLVVASGEWPWLALALAAASALYGLVRKLVAVDSALALAVEMLILLPPAAVVLGVALRSGTASFGQGNRVLDVLLPLSGVVTAVPLLLFGRAVQGLRLSTLGVLQYVAPGLQFLLALAAFGEPLQPAHAVGFGGVWAALLWFGVEAVLARRRTAMPAAPELAGRGGTTSGAILVARARARRLPQAARKPETCSSARQLPAPCCPGHGARRAGWNPSALRVVESGFGQQPAHQPAPASMGCSQNRDRDAGLLGGMG
jgi:chloramphenicol-sensitive protein RarD